mmetsp:Transcript_10180/g.22668  ORF Transcript_10180/g.22668 Transcript_10180/m.22668 type:complete len:495 (-) Transcript_10180:439-1923(-)
MDVFLPPNQRGRLSSAQKQRLAVSHTRRQVINAAAELLIWSHSAEAMKIKNFADCWDSFLLACHGGQSINSDTVKSAMQTMQTIIRKLRQELNSFARGQGFMLTDQFLIDASEIFHGDNQEGKIRRCFKARKIRKEEERQPNIEANQPSIFASNDSKIVPFASLAELVRATSVAAASSEEDDEIFQLEKEIYNKRVKATLQRLRGAAKRQERGVVVASIDISPLNHVAALISAAAMCQWDLTEGACTTNTPSNADDEGSVKLIVGESVHELRCYDDFLCLLDGIVSNRVKLDINAETFMSGEGVATTKALCNLLDRHVKRQDFLLLTPSQVCLAREVHQKFSDLGCRMHLHNADDLGERLGRAGAKAGDITISLAWDTYDDLDLHVFLPTGEEISYQNKKAKNGGIAFLDVDMNAGGRERTCGECSLGRYRESDSRIIWNIQSCCSELWLSLLRQKRRHPVEGQCCDERQEPVLFRRMQGQRKPVQCDRLRVCL